MPLRTMRGPDKGRGDMERNAGAAAEGAAPHGNTQWDEPERLKTILDNVGACIFIKDARRRYVYLNRPTHELLGARAQGFIGASDEEVFPPEVAAGIRDDDLVVLGRGETVSREQTLAVCPGEQARTWWTVKIPLHESDGRISGLCGISTEITQLRRVERSLQLSEERFRELAESLPLTVFEFDREGRFTYVNRAGLENFGYSQEDIERGLNVLQTIAAEDRERAGRAVASRLAGSPDSLQEYGALRKDGTTFPMTIDSAVVCRDGRPAGLRGVLSDLTLRKQVQEHALTAAKLASVGTLAGGIAHDFNNLLQGVSGSISLALQVLDRPAEARALLEQAEAALHRSVSLTNQLLAFAKGGRPVKKVVEPGPLVEAAAKFALSGSNAVCEFVIDPEARPVEADEGQIAQVVHNLVLNALQAMPEGGRLTIAVRNVPATAVLAAAGGGAADFVELAVCDEGGGIPPEHLGRVFDPYFSTKEAGSGLGLASTHAIVSGHGGEVRVRSELGRGSVFCVYLPASASLPEGCPPGPHAAGGGGRRVLLMDDDALLQKVVVLMLRSLGHEVAVAADGEAAIACFLEARAAGTPFDLVILDLTVRGGMGGRETMRRLQEIEPAVRAIVSSGYSEDAAIASHQEHGFRAALRKPYRLGDLGQAVECALAGGAP